MWEMMALFTEQRGKYIMKRVRCQSGIYGYQCRLRESYTDFEQWRNYSRVFGLAERLGYEIGNDGIEDAWNENPIIQGSVIPSDFKRIHE
jgi:hypothetical protein